MLAIAHNGDIFVADEQAASGLGEVIRVDPVTGAQTSISAGNLFVNLVNIATGINGEIFVVDQNAFGGQGGVIRVDPISGEPRRQSL